MNDLLARAGLDTFGFGMAQRQRLAKQREGFANAGRRLGLDERAQLGGDGIDAFGAKRHGHAHDRAHHVDGNGVRRNPAVDGGLLNE